MEGKQKLTSEEKKLAKKIHQLEKKQSKLQLTDLQTPGSKKEKHKGKINLYDLELESRQLPTKSHSVQNMTSKDDDAIKPEKDRRNSLSLRRTKSQVRQRSLTNPWENAEIMSSLSSFDPSPLPPLPPLPPIPTSFEILQNAKNNDRAASKEHFHSSNVSKKEIANDVFSEKPTLRRKMSLFSSKSSKSKEFDFPEVITLKSPTPPKKITKSKSEKVKSQFSDLSPSLPRSSTELKRISLLLSVKKSSPNCVVDMIDKQEYFARNSDASLKLHPVMNHIIYALLVTGVKVEGIFRVSGYHSKIVEMKQKLDKGEKLHLLGQDPHTLSGLLKLYIREESSPIPIKMRYLFLFVKHLDHHELCIKYLQGALSKIPESNYELLKNLMHLCHIIYNNSAVTLMDANSLALIFSPILLHGADANTLIKDLSSMNMVVQYFIKAYHKIFEEKSEPIYHVTHAKSNYTAKINNELSYSVNDEILVFCRYNDDMLYGFRTENKKFGLICVWDIDLPDYIFKIEPMSPSTLARTNSKNPLQVSDPKFDFSPLSSMEFNIKDGQQKISERAPTIQPQ